ncbi:MAG TPA: preprotein translocase subunit SecG [Caulobacteraceae bacterium]|nr:preprotein translocase subunit SecG [Caulobacteraceae bacterium]
MLLGILLAVLMVVCVALIGVILLQRSEGGALSMGGGGPGAFMTARGTGDLLTRTTEILVAAFFGLCLLMTIISSRERAASALIEKVKGLPTISAAPPAPTPAANPVRAAAPAAPLGLPPTSAPNFATPPAGSPLNLLGNGPAVRPAPAPRLVVPGAPQPVRIANATKTAKVQPRKVAPAGPNPATSSAAQPAPIVNPPAVVLPPPPAAPANQ